MDKRFYKVISLFIKAILLIASIFYILHKLTGPEVLASCHHLLRSTETIWLFFFSFTLMFLNWGLEALKWKLLMQSYEEMSWLQALQAIFAGVAISIFTPNRVGEFTGRIFFLKKADRVVASVRSMVGNFFQLSITLIAGIAGIWLYVRNGYDMKTSLFSIIQKEKQLLLLIPIMCTLIGMLIFLRMPYFEKWKQLLKESFKITRSEALRLWLLSLTRYLVFTFQYYLLVRAVGIPMDLIQAFTLISIVFFITSLIPSFALTEIVVRSAVAVYIFNALVPGEPLLIASASLFLWVINLAVPALIGSTFIGKLQFFKTQ